MQIHYHRIIRTMSAQGHHSENQKLQFWIQIRRLTSILQIVHNQKG